jgi:hypothetical protein
VSPSTTRTTRASCRSPGIGVAVGSTVGDGTGVAVGIEVAVGVGSGVAVGAVVSVGTVVGVGAVVEVGASVGVTGGGAPQATNKATITKSDPERATRKLILPSLLPFQWLQRSAAKPGVADAPQSLHRIWHS